MRRVKRAKLQQVGAPDEGAVTLAGDDQHPQVGIVRQGGHRLDEGSDLRLADAVQARGVVDRDGGDGAVTVGTRMRMVMTVSSGSSRLGRGMVAYRDSR